MTHVVEAWWIFNLLTWSRRSGRRQGVCNRRAKLQLVQSDPRRRATEAEEVIVGLEAGGALSDDDGRRHVVSQQV